MGRTGIDTFALVNGEAYSAVSIQNRGLNFGDGLFESLLYEDGHIPLVSLHVARLFRDCARLDISLDHELCHRSIEKMVSWASKQNVKLAKVKLVVSRGQGASALASYPDSRAAAQLILEANSMISANKVQGSNAVELVPAPEPLIVTPKLAGIKHLSRLPYIVAAQGVERSDSQEILFQDANGHVVETMHHNIFSIQNNTLRTPRLENCGVWGVMRALVIDKLAAAIGYCVEEGSLSLSDLHASDEIVICNAVRGFVPVKKMCESTFSGFDVCQKLQSAFEFYKKSL